jgi:hypothetical protein
MNWLDAGFSPWCVLDANFASKKAASSLGLTEAAGDSQAVGGVIREEAHRSSSGEPSQVHLSKDGISCIWAGTSNSGAKETIVMTRYRIEIEVSLDDTMKAEAIKSARLIYGALGRAHTMEGNKQAIIPTEKFIADTEDALLELAESSFRSMLPDIDPDALRCGVISPILELGAGTEDRARVYVRMKSRGKS